MMSTAVLNSEVLVLNRFFQAVQITSVRRAFCLFFKGYVKAVDEDYLTYSFNDWKDLPADGEVVHTPRFRLRVPRVVQLIHYEQVPRFRVRFSRKNIFMRDRNRCQYCGRSFGYRELSIDHVVPVSRGGRDSWDNVVCCCLGCNKRKGNRTPEESGLKLIRPPRRPFWIPFSRFATRAEPHPLWRNFTDFAYWNVALDEDRP